MLYNRFKERYPFLDVGFVQGGRPEMFARLEMETRLKKHIADVLLLGGSDMYILKKKGFFMKYVPKESKFFAEDKKDPEGFYVVVYDNLGAFVCNTRLVSPQDLPKNLNDLLDPKWKGQISAEIGKIYYFIPLFQYLGEEKGVTYLKKLAPQIIVTSGTALALNLLAAGEFKLIFSAATKSLDREVEKGMPAAPLFLEYIRQNTYPAGISNNAPHPNAAKLFMEWLLSEEGQTLFADLRMLSLQDRD